MSMTKEIRETEALQEIKAIIERLGMESYIGAALDGALELAESNINGKIFDTTQYFIEKSWELEKRAHAVTKERDTLIARVTVLEKSLEALQSDKVELLAENEMFQSKLDRLKVRLFDLMDR